MALMINGEKIPRIAVDQEAQRLMQEGQQMLMSVPQEEREEFIKTVSRENVIERVLITQAAKAENEEIDPAEVDAEFEQMVKHYGGRTPFFDRFGLKPEQEELVKKDIEMRIRIRRFLDRIVEKTEAPTVEEAREYYDANVDEFTEPEAVHASHIVKHLDDKTTREEAEATMEKAAKRLRNNGFFPEVAQEFSDCPDRGGDLGFFPKGQMVEKFEDIVFNMDEGEVSDVFETEFGLHIAKLHEKRPAKVHPFEEVKDKLMPHMQQMKQNAAIKEFVDAEKEKATIEDVEDDEVDAKPAETE
ncbi:MAG: peptidylprolyl isomerase [Candidatus Sumerlaeia bacterium]